MYYDNGVQFAASQMGTNDGYDYNMPCQFGDQWSNNQQYMNQDTHYGGFQYSAQNNGYNQFPGNQQQYHNQQQQNYAGFNMDYQNIHRMYPSMDNQQYSPTGKLIYRAE